MKYSINDLVIEVGRNCNLRCSHCLRGEPEDVTLDVSYIDALLQNVEIIESLTITGGEPFLYPAVIHHIVETIERLNISIGSFFVATNGLISSMSVITDLLTLYARCTDTDLCELRISMDRYHNTNNIAVWQVLDGLSFAYHETKTVSEENLIAEGRAALNYSSSRQAQEYMDEIVEFENYTHISGMIYLNALGDILISCDLSYDNQKNHSFGNISEESFDEIIAKIEFKDFAL